MSAAAAALALTEVISSLKNNGATDAFEVFNINYLGSVAVPSNLGPKNTFPAFVGHCMPLYMRSQKCCAPSLLKSTQTHTHSNVQIFTT